MPSPCWSIPGQVWSSSANLGSNAVTSRPQVGRSRTKFDDAGEKWSTPGQCSSFLYRIWSSLARVCTKACFPAQSSSILDSPGRCWLGVTPNLGKFGEPPTTPDLAGARSTLAGPRTNGHAGWVSNRILGGHTPSNSRTERHTHTPARSTVTWGRLRGKHWASVGLKWGANMGLAWGATVRG